MTTSAGHAKANAPLPAAEFLHIANKRYLPTDKRKIR
jgi:hypothetical protein